MEKYGNHMVRFFNRVEGDVAEELFSYLAEDCTITVAMAIAIAQYKREGNNIALINHTTIDS